MHAKASTDQASRSVNRPSPCLRIKYTLNPVQTDSGIGISSLGTGKVPSRSRVSRPGASMSGCGPDDEGMERPTVYKDTFDYRNQSPLNTYSFVTEIVLTC